MENFSPESTENEEIVFIENYQDLKAALIAGTSMENLDFLQNFSISVKQSLDLFESLNYNFLIPQIVKKLPHFSFSEYQEIISQLSKKNVAKNWLLFFILVFSEQQKDIKGSSIFENFLPHKAMHEILSLESDSFSQAVEKLACNAQDELLINLPQYESSKRKQNAQKLNQIQQKSLEFFDIENPDIRYLSLYTRYGHTVNFGPALEVLIHFLHHYIAGGYSPIFEKIRLIPRKSLYAPLKSTQDLSHIEYLSDVSDSEFLEAMSLGANPFYFSHSTEEGGDLGARAIISTGMEYQKNKLCLTSPLEFEKRQIPESRSSVADMNTLEICTHALQDIQKLEKKLLEDIEKFQK